MEQHPAPPAPPTPPPQSRKPPNGRDGPGFQQLPKPGYPEGPPRADGSDGKQDGKHYHHKSVALRHSADAPKSPPSPENLQPKEDPIPPGVVQRISQITIDNDNDVQKLIREYSKDSSLNQSVKTRIHQLIHSVRYRRRRDREAEQIRKHLEKEGLEISYSNVVDPETGKYMLGCEHYPRACKLKAACCDIWVVCRQCHDRDGMGHAMPRHDTKEVMCMRCGMIQPVSRTCVQCHKDFARYFCDICKFYDNTPGKSIYHCKDCKICRVGRGIGIDNFHCKRCDACVSKDYAENHRCLKKSLDANCPICGQYLYTSTKPVVFMRCGHTMHSHCFDAYTAENFTCPLCQKTLTNMKPYYQQIDAELERHEMPDEHKDMMSEILCHDCDRRSVTNYHYVYHKCGHCASYNTRQIRIFQKGEGSSKDVTHRGASPGPGPGSSAMETASPEPCSETDDKEDRNMEVVEVVPVGVEGDEAMDDT